MADLVSEARMLADGGVRELNLIAQDLTAYGRDLDQPSSLAKLAFRLERCRWIHWIGLLYCYPNFVTDELLDAIEALPKLTKYIDMPLQHADDDILRAMGRERSGSRARAGFSIASAARPRYRAAQLFIVGFPGETEEAFERWQFIREQEFDRVGVFTYSLEENTAAFDLPRQFRSA